MSGLTNIQQFLPDLAARADDPPVNQQMQTRVSDSLNAVFGQSAEFLNPLLFQSGRLVIFVNAPVWGTHIRHRHESIQQRLQECGLKVTEIEVKISPQINRRAQVTPSERPAVNEINTTTETNKTTLSRASDQISDPDLREALKRLAKRL